MASPPDSPAARYARAIDGGTLTADAAQARAVDALQRVYDDLLAAPPSRGLLRRARGNWTPVTGLYLWGGVGRGKTMLMDQFFETLPMEERKRTHFHRFMLEIHAARRRYLDEQDPVALIAERIAENTRVLCFDEFFVSDVADAMILGRLSEVLFRNGVTLVTTSNVAPDDLYQDGLQRARFLPAIQRIKQHCQVMELTSPVDFRLRLLEQLPRFITPNDDAARAQLHEEFTALSGGHAPEPVQLEVCGRQIAALGAGNDIAWFDFAELCQSARAAADYIALGREYQTIMVSDVPVLDSQLEDSARRFVHMVDEFYDRGVKLIMSAAAPLTEIYRGSKLQFEFQRTQSRLIEMQSRDYLSRPHAAV